MNEIKVEKISPLMHRIIWTTLALVLLVGLIIRIHVARIDTFPSVDGVFYLNQSQELVQTGRISFSTFPPGWPMISALPLFFMDSEDPLSIFRSAQIANVILGTIFTLLSFLAIRRFMGPIPALLGAVVLAGLPMTIVASKGDLSDLSYACVILGGWLLFQDRRLFLSGLAFGYAYWIRPEVLVAVLALCLFLVWREWRIPWAFLAAFSFCLVPYFAYTRMATGSWVFSSKMVFLSDSFSAHPGSAYLVLIGKNLATIFRLLLGTVGAPLVLLAMWGAWRRPSSYLLVLTPLLILPLFDFAMVGRFWLPYLPFVLISAGLAGRDLSTIGKRRISRLNHSPRFFHGSAGVLVAIVTLGIIWVSPDDANWVFKSKNSLIGLRDTGIWLRKYVDNDTAIASYKPFTSFWAGCKFIPYPEGTDTLTLVDQVIDEGAQFLIVNFQVARYHRREIIPLLEEPGPAWLGEKLELVKILRYVPDGHTTVVYRVKDTVQ